MTLLFQILFKIKLNLTAQYAVLPDLVSYHITMRRFRNRAFKYLFKFRNEADHVILQPQRTCHIFRSVNFEILQPQSSLNHQTPRT